MGDDRMAQGGTVVAERARTNTAHDSAQATAPACDTQPDQAPMHRAHAHEVTISCATLADLFEARVAQAPDALAYGFVSDDLRPATSWTAATLAAKVRALAFALSQRAATGEAVLLVYPAGLEFVRAFWACVWLGLVPVPVSSLDAARLRSGLTRLRSIGADARARLVLCDERTLALVRAQGALGADEQWFATDSVADAEGHHRVGSGRAGRDLAYLQYTSGSTTAPRGVMVTHASALANCSGLTAALQPDEHAKVLSWLPHFHDYGLMQGIVCPLFAGVPAFLMSPITFLRHPLRWLEAIDRLAISHSGAPNFAYAACLAALDSRPDWRGDLRSWQHAGCGAEPIQAQIARQFVSRFAEHGLQERAFAPAYGLAEATLLVSVKPPDQAPSTLWVDAHALQQRSVHLVDASAPGARELVRCGPPIDGLEVRVIDPDTRRGCEPGTVGELWVRGSSIGAGYLGQSADGGGVFQQALANDPATDWLRTGDLGFVHDGQLVVAGRLKDLLIVNGRNVYPQDIEWTVERACAGLRQGYGAAFAVDGAAGERAIVLQEVERRSQSGDLAAMASAIRAAVAREHDLPLHAVVLLKAGTIARTSSGKIQRGRCRADYLQGRLTPLHVDLQETNISTAQRVESGRTLQVMLEGIGALTGRPPGMVRADRSAVDNGLDSLAAFRLLDILESRLNLVLSPSLVLGSQSLAEVAQHLDALGPMPSEHPAAAHEEATPPGGASALSWQQQAVWFADRIGDHGLYNLAQATRLRGTLDAARLESSLAVLVERHEALRVAVRAADDTVLQFVQEHAMPTWHRVDLASTRAEHRLAELQQRLDRMVRQGFDVASAPLLRVALFRLGADDHVLALVVHHMVFDGWSASLLMREWAALYEGRGSRELGERPGGYLRYVAWQQRLLANPSAAAVLHELRDRLAGTPNLDLPGDRPRPTQPTFNGALHRFEIDAACLHEMRAAAAQHKVTLFMLLMAAFQALMGRLSGQDDFAVGTPAAARPNRSFEQTVGLFANTLVLRADLAGQPTFRELLRRVRESALFAYQHQAIPFDRLTSELRRERDLRRNALFQVGLALHSMGDTRLRLTGLDCEDLPLHHGAARTDLWLAFSERAGVLYGELEYASDLFDAASAQRVAAQFRRLLDAALADPDVPLSRLNLLDDAQRRFVLQHCNATQREHPLQWGLHELFERQAQRSAQVIAVRAGEHTLSYAQLDGRANQLAHHLIGLGVGPETIVGVCLPRSLELSVALLAVLKAGGAYLPLDPELPAQRLAYMLRDAGARIVLTDCASRDVLQQADADTLRLALDEQAGAWAAQPASAPPQRAAPHDTAYVIYTSGSSGEPKAVAVSHRAMCNHQHWALECTALAPAHRMLQLITIGFDASVLELFTPLLAGATLTMAPPGMQRDMRELVRTVRQHAITHLVMTPSTARALLDEPELAHCTSVQHLLLGGEPLSLDLVRALRACLGELRITNCYGPTEAATTATFHDVSATPEGKGFVPIGRPIDNTWLHVLDGAMQPVPLGVVGELYIGGAGLARGYLQRPELTAERFVADPWAARERLYRTGDLTRRRADGALEFLGRADCAGEDPRPPDRARRDRGRVAALPRRAPGCSGGTRQRAWRMRAGGLRGGRCLRRVRAARAVAPVAAGGAVARRVGGAAGVAAAAQWQARCARAARAAVRRRSPRAAADRHRAPASCPVVRVARARCLGPPRQLLRVRRALAHRHAPGGSHPCAPGSGCAAAHGVRAPHHRRPGRGHRLRAGIQPSAARSTHPTRLSPACPATVALPATHVASAADGPARCGLPHAVPVAHRRRAARAGTAPGVRAPGRAPRGPAHQPASGAWRAHATHRRTGPPAVGRSGFERAARRRGARAGARAGAAGVASQFRSRQRTAGPCTADEARRARPCAAGRDPPRHRRPVVGRRARARAG